MKNNSVIKNILKGNHALSTTDILEYCKHNSIPLNNCISKDNLPLKALKNGDCYVLNLDTPFNAGTHWVALCCNKNQILFYDPYGLPPPERILDVMFMNKKTKYLNEEQNQLEDTIICGHYCLSLLKSVYRDGLSFQKYMDKLYDEPNGNRNRKIVLLNLK